MYQQEISVIISTYNQPEWLEKVLWGYHAQSYTHFEVVIADDGSGEATKNCIQKMQQKLNYPVIHVWQKDDGFQKSRILNKAILAARAPYIVMSDGDCIPRNDFLSVHHHYRKVGYFLSGGYFMLPMEISKSISKEEILNGQCFTLKWLKSRDLGSSFKNNKLTSKGAKSQLLNALTPTRATWNGHNASGWKKDMMAINGFDERMQYGGQDREFGERLINNGIRSKQIRYSAICLHLDHSRGYKTPETLAKNAAIRKKTKIDKMVWTPYGIEKEAIEHL